MIVHACIIDNSMRPNIDTENINLEQTTETNILSVYSLYIICIFKQETTSFYGFQADKSCRMLVEHKKNL